MNRDGSKKLVALMAVFICAAVLAPAQACPDPQQKKKLHEESELNSLREPPAAPSCFSNACCGRIPYRS